MKNEIKDIKKEIKPGFLDNKHRVTSQDSNGRIGVSGWQPNEAKATQEARERLGGDKKTK